MTSKMTAIILAGGKSSRFGSDKAFIKIGGIPLINRQLRLLKKIFKKIIVVTNNPEKHRFGAVKSIRDIIKNRGPLGGIHSGLRASDSFHNFVFACDMPFLNGSLIKYISAKKDAYDVIIPKINKRAHPLFGVYSKNCIPIIEEMLKLEKLKISGLFDKVKTHFISKKEIERFDENLSSLVNINTRIDLVSARQMKEV